MTAPHSADWPDQPHHRDHRRIEITTPIGRGDADFARAAHLVLRWGVKTASGFTVSDDSPVTEGQHLTVTARIAGFTVREPVRVDRVTRSVDRVGFSYCALPGHPVRGEEAFVVHREGDRVFLTIRSLTRPAPSGWWRTAYPALLVAQRIAHRRYARALIR
ncbi:DUF1990 domain-containing protein [Tsukamurella serpentis]